MLIYAELCLVMDEINHDARNLYATALGFFDPVSHIQGYN
jgi:hypothetical protein